ncbi:hypothetical protein [Paenibacillus riograndensis]|uniref:Uncharacterized protein n=1 Tax=Paenibacillus riograndensis SBR5 TaxID=1073571 RepID=A0A0E4H5X7_9BACL|nr:hypothetical protein [Paenibacillus riograndensis]CQR51438.1 hypothetical protein PRIO_0202 [Paenibacillus riograndensis SBR5]
MKAYDFQKAKLLIEQDREQIQEAALGMYEDWFWTAEEVFNDQEGFVRDLETVELIGGINESSWATPCLRITYRDGNESCIGCFKDDGSPSERGFVMPLGVLSGPAQDRMPPLTSKEGRHD